MTIPLFFIQSINIIISCTEKNNILWVDKGVTAAGSVNDGDWTTPGRLPDGLTDKMRIIYRSEAYPRAFELVTAALSDTAAKALAQRLSTLDTRKPELMQRYEQTSRFEAASEQDLNLLRQLPTGVTP